MVERIILIDSLSGPNFAIRTAEMDRSRTEFTDLCFWKDIHKETFWRKVETFSLLSDENVWQKFCENGVIDQKQCFRFIVARAFADKMCCAVRKFEIEP